VPTTVTTQSQLISAINAANIAGGEQTISLGANITLFETTPNNTHDGPNGLPEITNGDNLTINGNGLTIQRKTGPFGVGDAAFRLFDVGSGGTLNLSDMVLENGLVSGPRATIVGSGAIFQGGAIFVDSGGTLNLNQVNVTNSAVSCTVQTPLGPRVVEGSLEVQGGGIYNAGAANIVSSLVTGNFAESQVTVSPGRGDNLGDNFSSSEEGSFTGDGLNGNVIVEGGGIYNVGSLIINSSSISKNSATSTVTNGSLSPAGNVGNGDSNGDGDIGKNDGGFNGNGVNGNIIVEGGGIFNTGITMLMGGSLSGNSAKSTVTNGSHNGNNNGDNDTGFNNGGFDGNGVAGNITVAGGGIFNAGALKATGTKLAGNTADSSVVNGSNNGVGDGDGTFNTDGDDNGDGVVGNILVAGGAVANFLNSGSLTHCTVTGNVAASSITNGSADGNNNGDSNTGVGEGKNNGDGVAGNLDVAGAGIDNEGNTLGGNTSMTITFGTVSDNGASSSISNGSANGNNDGNNDGEGCGITVSMEIHGGGIRNLGILTISSVTLTGNLVQSSVFNGDADGNSNGKNDSRSHEGRENGNGVSGGVLVAGGAIANGGTGTLSATSCMLSFNIVGSVVSNGNDNGQSDGQGDFNGATDCGNFCGNGVGAEGGSLVEVDGGGLGNAGSATLNSCMVTGNDVSSSVTIGVNDGVGSPDVGGNGQGDGNGIDGQLRVIGGGTANVGTLHLNSTTPTGNLISSNVTNGSNDITKDGQVVNGTVTVSGSDTFAPVAHDNFRNALENQTGYQVASIALPPSRSAPAIMLDPRDTSSPARANQRALMEPSALAHEGIDPSAETAIPVLHRTSHSSTDAFFLEPWGESTV
jgi:hypothetical protein